MPVRYKTFAVCGCTANTVEPVGRTLFARKQTIFTNSNLPHLANEQSSPSSALAF